ADRAILRLPRSLTPPRQPTPKSDAQKANAPSVRDRGASAATRKRLQVVRTNRRTTVALGALGGARQHVVHLLRQRLDQIARRHAAGVLDHVLHLRTDDEDLLRTTLARLLGGLAFCHV